eukprot:TRINITY_DN21688_c0_g1_i2.p1 TRINITY_DN21688_c0_g1~~TRINITY_DN21688_c0_g1_i2.p1  ORF type:complete len:542 (+),score=88.99 TRINITY_DN21688_c0_g1_i2:108-1733(+)
MPPLEATLLPAKRGSSEGSHRRAQPKEVVAALGRLGRQQQWQQALQLLAAWDLETPDDTGAGDERAVQGLAAPEAKAAWSRSVLWNAAGSACDRASQWRWALQTSSTLARTNGQFGFNGFSHNGKIAALGKAQNWHAALQCFWAACSSGGQYDGVGCNAAVAACSRQACWSTAVLLSSAKVLRQLALEVDCTGINSALHGLASRGIWSRSAALLEQTSGRLVKPDIISINTVISATEPFGKWQFSLAVLFGSRRGSSHADMLVATPVTYGAIASVTDKAGRWSEALALLLHARAALTELNIVAYSATLDSCERAGAWTGAMAILQTLPDHSVDANIVACGAALSSCAASCRWWCCTCLLQEAPKRWRVVPDAVCHASVLSAYENIGGWREALDLARNMAVLEEVCTLDTVAWCSLSSSCEKAGEWAWTLQLLDVGVSSWKLQPDLVFFTSVVSSCRRSAEWRTGLRALESMSSAAAKPNSITFRDVLAACEDGADVGEGVASATISQRREIEAPAAVSHGLRILRQLQGFGIKVCGSCKLL